MSINMFTFALLDIHVLNTLGPFCLFTHDFTFYALKRIMSNQIICWFTRAKFFLILEMKSTEYKCHTNIYCWMMHLLQPNSDYVLMQWRSDMSRKWDYVYIIVTFQNSMCHQSKEYNRTSSRQFWWKHNFTLLYVKENRE